MNGQILKIKTGYNPNSSSIGADVMVFFTAGAAVALLFNSVTTIFDAIRAQEKTDPAEVQNLPVSDDDQERP